MCKWIKHIKLSGACKHKTDEKDDHWQSIKLNSNNYSRDLERDFWNRRDKPEKNFKKCIKIVTKRESLQWEQSCGENLLWCASFLRASWSLPWPDRAASPWNAVRRLHQPLKWQYEELHVGTHTMRGVCGLKKGFVISMSISCIREQHRYT